MNFARPLLPLVPLLFLFGCGEPDVWIDQRSSAIIGGSEDLEHGAVGLLVHDSSVPGDDKVCTATLIDPRFALTAAHCVTTTKAPYRKLEPPIYLFLGKAAHLDSATGVPAGELILVDEITFHPAYAGAGLSDIAVVRLASTVPASVAIPIGLGSAPPTVGTTVTLVGFGLSDAGDLQSYGTRRQATGKITARTTTTFKIDGHTNHGDSGGPALVMSDELRVIGVHSGTSENAKEESGTDIRVDSYRDWIADVVAGELTDEEPLAPAASYGEDCADSTDCASHICVKVSRLFSSYSACSHRCTRSADCPNRDSCDWRVKVCVPSRSRSASSGEDDPMVEVVGGGEHLDGDGCALGPARPRGASSPWLLAGLALLLGWRGRPRRAA